MEISLREDSQLNDIGSWMLKFQTESLIGMIEGMPFQNTSGTGVPSANCWGVFPDIVASN
jgi:hypothetical protein